MAAGSVLFFNGDVLQEVDANHRTLASDSFKGMIPNNIASLQMPSENLGIPRQPAHMTNRLQIQGFPTTPSRIRFNNLLEELTELRKEIYLVIVLL